MNGYFDNLRAHLNELDEQKMYRKLREITQRDGCKAVIDGRECVLFCSNDYLNLADHPRVKRAAIDAAKQWGLGSGASRLVCGSLGPHIQLEKKMAAFLRKEAGLYFPSGWTANEALLKNLPGKGDLVLIDKLDHASIVDAVRGGEASFRTYHRGQMDRLERFLEQGGPGQRFIVTESVFSMDGDTANLEELVRLKEKYDAILIVDEAHGLGCLGNRGAGLCEEMNTLDDVDIIVAPLGKAMGASGCVIASNAVVREYLINRGRGFIYTTAPSPVIAAGAFEALSVLQEEPERMKKLRENANYLRRRLQETGFDTGQSSTQIIPVILSDPEKTMKVSQGLFDRGYFAVGIRPPTVAVGTSRLRISVQQGHTREQLDGLCDAIQEAYRESRR